mmetsp:Transcript_35498/g.99711  ORF Transcript_35498/g.99711 Transcript_35498/m.99711 type:complete len:282 (-) Transcript_35498:64-909(-)
MQAGEAPRGPRHAGLPAGARPEHDLLRQGPEGVPAAGDGDPVVQLPPERPRGQERPPRGVPRRGGPDEVVREQVDQDQAPRPRGRLGRRPPGARAPRLAGRRGPGRAGAGVRVQGHLREQVPRGRGPDVGAPPDGGLDEAGGPPRGGGPLAGLVPRACLPAPVRRPAQQRGVVRRAGDGSRPLRGLPAGEARPGRAVKAARRRYDAQGTSSMRRCAEWPRMRSRVLAGPSRSQCTSFERNHAGPLFPHVSHARRPCALAATAAVIIIATPTQDRDRQCISF